MTPEFIETLSKKSAYKYYNTSHYDDLVSEGIIAAYEEYNLNPKVSEQRLYQVISTAQWKLLNVDCVAVTIPFEVVRLAKGLGSPEEKRGYSEEVIEWAKLICAAPQLDSNLHGKDLESNQAVSYEEQALVRSVWEAAEECLTDEEYDLFHSYFNVGLDGKSLGELTGVSKQAVNKKLKVLNKKVKKHLVNKKWGL